MLKLKKYNFTYTQLSALSFIGIIFIGAVLLSLPISSRSGEATPFIDALFTSASATCVTGLAVYDTYTYFSVFGQVVILALIQIGGLGFMIIATLFSLMLKRKIGLKERGLLQQSVNTINIGGVVRLTKHILLGTLLIEGIGAILLSIRFCKDMGLIHGIYYGVFHSISAFCNAGFDLMGKIDPGSSLIHYRSDPLVNIVIISLIIIGGIGFWVWEDVLNNKFKFIKYRLHTKIVIVITSILVIGGTIIFYILEHNNAYINMNVQEGILAALFQSVTPRTAGFSTVNLSDLSEGSIFVTILLMVIGGCPGSTAGGIKTTTFVVIILSLISSLQHSNDLNIFNRRLETEIVKRAFDIITIYYMAATIAILGICMIDKFALRDIIVEVVSALSTVGMSAGITSSLGCVSKVIITCLMYEGRIGSLSVALVFTEKKEFIPIRKPVEKIAIG